MKISVAHSTVYRYDRPVELGPHVFRLRPRDDGGQKLLCHDLRIHPEPMVRSEAADQDGNVVAHAWFKEPVSALEVHSRFSVQTLRENPFDFLLSEKPMARLPLEYPAASRSVLGPYIHTGAVAETVAEFARTTAEDAAWRTIGFLVELSVRIQSELRAIDRAEGPAQAAEETLRLGQGACRDFAVLFCSACRAMGLAARFVSGYECEAARDPAHAYMHAWAEVYLPGGGWRGFDPSRGLAAATSHVPVAAALEPELAAPISGSYRGAGHSTMETSIRMQASD